MLPPPAHHNIIQHQQPPPPPLPSSSPPVPASSSMSSTTTPGRKPHIHAHADSSKYVYSSSGTRQEGDISIWIGTWNLGAADPFSDSRGLMDDADTSRMVRHLVPVGYDLYVLGVQEGVNENVYFAIQAYLNRNPQLLRYQRKELRNDKVVLPNKQAPTDAVFDAVRGRGDGAFMGTKFTGMAVFCGDHVAADVQVLRAGLHKFNIASGSKGGVAVALKIKHSTLCLINCHLDARNDTYRRDQIRLLNTNLGKVMGHPYFDLTQQFHHVVWMGDLNYRIVKMDATEVCRLLTEDRIEELHDRGDGLLNDRKQGIFEGFKEPDKFHNFYPTYKKFPLRGHVDMDDPRWPERVYRVLYKEPFYKGGQVKKRVPGWCDRILVYSTPMRNSDLVAEKVPCPFIQGRWVDNYQSINDGVGMDVSDHSPVTCTMLLKFVRPAMTNIPGGLAPDGLGAYTDLRPSVRLQGPSYGGGPHGPVTTVLTLFNMVWVYFFPETPVTYESVVIDVKPEKVKVHYLTWGDKWNVWLSRDSSKLERLHSRADEWRSTLGKGAPVEFSTAATTGIRGSWVEATVVDVQVVEGDDEGTDDVWPRPPPRSLYTGKTIRVKVQFTSGGLPHTKSLDASSELLSAPNVHIRRQTTAAVVATDIVKADCPQSNYSYSSGTYTTNRNTSWSTPSSSGYHSTKYTAKAEFQGVVGLHNLGNTCFLNSVLQCLSNSKPLLDYFFQTDNDGGRVYMREINPRNPLGMGGKIAKAYAKLMEKMWSGESKVVTPSDLKYVIGEYAPAFAGYAQHDSQEVLSFILDGIHEDLNRVLEKPYTKPIEHAGRPDADVAKEEWANYLLRNDSVVVDHCMAQLRSHVTCPSCQNESITFDPYMSLSLPVPNQAWVLLTLHGIGSRPTQFGLHVPKEGVYADVKAALSAQSGVPIDRLLVVQVKHNRIVRSYADSMDIGDLVYATHRDVGVVAYEVEYPVGQYEVRSPTLYSLSSASTLDLNQRSPGELALCLVALQHQVPATVTEPSSPSEDDSEQPRTTNCSYRYNTNHHTKHRRVERQLFGAPALVSITRDASSAEIHDKIRQVTEHLVDPDLQETPYKLHVSNSRADTFLHRDVSEESADPLPNDITRGSFTFTLEWTPHGYKEGRLGCESPRLHVSADSKPASSSLDLRTCIAKFTEKEQLGENDTWYCPKCKAHVRAFKKFDLFSLPNILLLHLKRFRYAQGSYSMQRDKINTLVTFPVSGLDMADFVVGNIPPDTSTVYDLYAVSEHMGGLGGGHYTAKAMNPRNHKWYSFNDSSTSDTTADDAITSHAYVLFYLRRALPTR
ncbi:hypothetical protein B5M09_003267 [Aphanomyces astaci]|uniref:USP domain-containing protein n=2 Tax=Aphanomyces astaci TaxID=112090 RepID=A0A3R7WLY4_APHAT|nr:hypothetical protein B5M09_003267 [Aphanomyces astaci]